MATRDSRLTSSILLGSLGLVVYPGSRSENFGATVHKRDVVKLEASDRPTPTKTDVEERLQRARTVAKQFCDQFQYSERQVKELSDPPRLGPITIDRNGQSFEVYRWLGHGRGQPCVQVEIEVAGPAITVYGGLADKEFGPWHPPRRTRDDSEN